MPDARMIHARSVTAVKARSVASAIRRLYGRKARAGAHPERIGVNYYSVMVVQRDRYGTHVIGTMRYSEEAR